MVKMSPSVPIFCCLMLALSSTLFPGCTSLTCFKCGGRGEINCADLYRFHFFRIAQIKFGVACSTPENEEPIEMCYKQPATDQRLEEKGCTTHEALHKDFELCDTDFCNSANGYRYGVAMFILTLLVIIANFGYHL